MPNRIWLWKSVDGEEAVFQHPSDLPSSHRATEAFFDDCVRGPSIARLTPAMLVNMSEKVVRVKAGDTELDVPKAHVLPWYEGLMVLESLVCEGGGSSASHAGALLTAAWLNEVHKSILDQERKKFKPRTLNGMSMAYVETRLLEVVVTGCDAQGNCRRDVKDGGGAGSSA